MAKIDVTNLPGRGIKPLVSLKAHKRAALIAFIVIFLAGIPLVFIKGQVFYSTGALVLVAPRYMKNLRDDGELDLPSNTQYREFLQQQTKSVGRYDIVRDALLALGNKAGGWRKGNETERQSIERLRDSLVVRPIHDTYMIEITLQSKDKEGLAEAVNAIVDTYIQRMRDERVFGANSRIQMLKDREADILNAIREGTAKRTELALQLGLGTFSGKEESPYNKILYDLRASVADARNKRIEADVQLQAYEAYGETDIRIRSVQDVLLNDPGLSSLKSSLFKQRGDLLIQLSGLQADHPIYQEVTAQLSRVDTEINNQTNSLKAQIQQSLHTRLKISAEQARHVEDDLKKELDEMEKNGTKYASLYNQAVTLTYDIEQQLKELDAVRSRLNIFASEENSFGFVRLVTPALPPEIPYGPGKKKILLMVLAAGLLMMIVVPVGIDLLDRRIQTVNDTEKIMGIPALGWMVERVDEATSLFAEDLLRSMAGALINEQQKQGTHVFAITSVKPGGGASDLTLLLAKSLNQLGYRALAVEANAFNTDSRYAGEQPGLAECLRGTTQPYDCIVPACSEYPARVHVGDIGGKLHLDHIDRVAEVIKAWSEEFNFVLVDLPPLLLSADAEILARKLQQLLVVVEANGIIAGELRRAKRQLEKLDPNAIGVVVNRVRPFDGGGYLQGMLVEYLSGRKLPDYYTTPLWIFNLKAQWISLQLRYPKLALLAERLQLLQAKFLSSRKIPEKNPSIERKPELTGKSYLPWNKKNSGTIPSKRRHWLAGLILLFIIGGIGYFLAKKPDLWVNFLSDVVAHRSTSARTPGDSSSHLTLPSELSLSNLATISSTPINVIDIASNGHATTKGITRQLLITLGTFLQYIVPLFFILGGVISFFARFRKTETHIPTMVHSGQSTLETMALPEFKQLAAEAFEHRGYEVTFRDKNHNPGRIADFELSKGNRKFIVYCKQWRESTIETAIITKLCGIIKSESAQGGFIVASGNFSDDARNFADQYSIKLISPHLLAETLKEAKTTDTEQSKKISIAPSCSRCGGKMVEQILKKGNMAGSKFWICASYPGCPEILT